MLVIYHVVGASNITGLRLPETHYLRTANHLIDFIRMPLFAFIAGYTLKVFSETTFQFDEKMNSRVFRLIPPFIIVSSLTYFSQILMGFERDIPFLHIFVIGYQQFWFIQSIIILISISLVVGLFFKQRDFTFFAVGMMIVGTTAPMFVDRWQPDLLSAYKAIYLAPYFFLGVITSIHTPSRLIANFFSIVAWTGLLVYIYLNPTELTNDLTSNDIDFEKYILGAFAVCITLYAWQPNIKYLSWMAPYAFTIFLFHNFFTAGARIVLTKFLNLQIPEILLILGVAIGIVGPVILHLLLKRMPKLALLVIGTKSNRKSTAYAPRET